MLQSPLKKKFALTLNTSRGNRGSINDSTLSKSPFRSSTDQFLRCSQLEQELHRANQQRKLLALELDDMSNQYIKKSKALQQCEMENQLLQKQLQSAKQQDDIQKMHQLLRQKNQIILEWSNKFQQLEKKIEHDSTLDQQLKQQQQVNEAMRVQLQEVKMQQKIMQENYRELKQERNVYYKKMMDSQGAQSCHEQQLKELTTSNQQLQQQIDQQIKTNNEELKLLQIKKDKWKCRYKDKIKTPQESHRSQQSDSPSIYDKLQELENENQQLREQNIDMQTQLQTLTDKLLKQQLQSSMSRDQSVAFSFQQYHQYESIDEESEIHDDVQQE